MQLTRNTLPPILASAKLEHLPNVLAKHRDLKQQPTQLIIFLLHTSLETAISFRQQRHDAFILRMHICVFLQNLISKKKKTITKPFWQLLYNSVLSHAKSKSTADFSVPPGILPALKKHITETWLVSQPSMHLTSRENIKDQLGKLLRLWSKRKMQIIKRHTNTVWSNQNKVFTLLYFSGD